MVDQDQTPTLPQRKATRLNQMVDVSRKAATPGDSLVFTDDGDWEPQNVTPGPDEITDVMIGNRTVTDTTAPASTGTLTAILGGIGNLIKQITGNASWVTAPPISLTALLTHAARHATGGPDAVSPASIGASDVNHTHALADAIGHSGFMSTSDKAKLDSVQANADATTLATTAPVAIGIGQAGAAGSSTTVSRRDHVHASPDVATAGVSGFMSGSDKTKLDGIASGATNTPLGGTGSTLTVAQVGSAGTSTSASRADHKHGLPNLASAVNDGFMSSADWSKLQGMTANVAGTVSFTDTATADQQLTSVNNSMPGISYFVGTTGTYWVALTVDFLCLSTNDVGATFVAEVFVAGSGTGIVANYSPAANGARVTMSIPGIVSLTSGQTVTLQVKKVGGSGNLSKASINSTKVGGFLIA